MSDKNTGFTDEDRRTLQLIDRRTEHTLFWKDDIKRSMERMGERMNDVREYADKRAIVVEDRCARLEEKCALLMAQFEALKAGLGR